MKARTRTILLLRQYRYAGGGYLYEVPAGRPASRGEDWEVCARRELEEETGLIAGPPAPASPPSSPRPDSRTSGSTSSWRRTSSPGTTALDHDEFIETGPDARSPERCEMVREGEIDDAKTLCTLLFAAGFLLGT